MRRAAALLVSALVVSSSCPAAVETFAEKVRAVKPGMSQDDVVRRLGEPEAIVHSGYGPDGRLVEIWRYFAGVDAPAQVTARVPASSGVAAAVSVPTATAASGDMAARVRQDSEFWNEVNRSAVGNAADANYTPVFAKAAPRPATAVETAPTTYRVVFVDGAVESVDLAP